MNSATAGSRNSTSTHRLLVWLPVAGPSGGYLPQVRHPESYYLGWWNSCSSTAAKSRTKRFPERVQCEFGFRLVMPRPNGFPQRSTDGTENRGRGLSGARRRKWNYRDVLVLVLSGRRATDSPSHTFSSSNNCIVIMKVLSLFVTSLAAVSAFAPAPTGRASTQVNESLFDKVCAKAIVILLLFCYPGCFWLC